MNHYERLDVDRGVTPPELARAYRREAQQHHPDRNGEDAEEATIRMVAINEAFAVLSDPVRRFDYNRSLDRASSEMSEKRRPGKDTAPARTPRPSPASPPPDDPARRAQRQAKEREAAKAKQRGYRPQGPSGGMDFSAPK